MSTLVKNQHYVWRSYLKPWSVGEKGEQICTYFINQNKIGVTSLMNIAQERFFYEIHPLSDIELLAAKKFTSQFPAFVQPCADVLLSTYAVVSKGILPDSEQYVFAKNSYERVFTYIEQHGIPLLQCRSIADIVKLQDLEKILWYICTQYGRTKKMRMNVVIGSQAKPLVSQLYDKLFPLITILYATTLAHNLFYHPNTKYIFVKNTTNIPFLTSDQPVINLLNDDIDEHGNVLSFELYYPTTPSTALIISLDSKMEKYSEKIADEEFVKQLNSKICENAFSFIFAKEKDNFVNFLTPNSIRNNGRCLEEQNRRKKDEKRG